MRILVLIILLSGLARGGALFDRANAAYDAGRFDDAVEGYEKLLERDGPRAAVLQNLGSAYHQLGEEGRAILAFERALLLRPGDPDLRANLKLARDQAAVFPAEPGGAWHRLVGRISRRQWSILELAGMALVPLAAFGWVILRERRGRGWMIPLGAAGGIVAGLSFAALRTAAAVEHRGIIVADAATIRISPFPRAEEKGSLGGGREVRLGEERNGWFWIRVDGGAGEGWVAPGEVEPLVARP
jgi:tetratricopeptide (TPR) repeat protein